jgi:hypothetical protein
MRVKVKLYGVYFLILLVLLLLKAPGCKSSVIENSNPEGTLLNYAGCKGETASTFQQQGKGSINQGEAPECIVFEYNGSILKLTHVNAWLNCCPELITAVLQIQDQSISITEEEAVLGCFCDCYYDIDYQISNLSPGVYTISIRHGSEVTFECTIDLASNRQGEICR